MIRVIVFDFGNVLAHFSHTRAARQLAAYSTLGEEIVRQRIFDTPLEDGLDVGAIEPPFFRAELRRRIEATHGSDAELDLAFSDMFTRNDAICDVLPTLARGFRLLLLSNTNALHAAQFTREYASDLSHFEHLILSHEVRARKPDRPIYVACQERAACSAAEILFVDDRADNIATAREIGWNAIHYQPMQGLPEPLRLLTI